MANIIKHIKYRVIVAFGGLPVNAHTHDFTEWKEYAGIKFRYCYLCGRLERDFYGLQVFPISATYYKIIKALFNPLEYPELAWND